MCRRHRRAVRQPETDTWDQRGVAAVYPPVAQGPHDVGVIPAVGGSCPAPTEVKIHMDNEDSNNNNQSSGWTGAISSGRNTLLEFCKIDGTKLGRLPAPSSGSAKYAVLKLGAQCPPGSTEFKRYHDDEDGTAVEHKLDGRRGRADANSPAAAPTLLVRV